MTSTPELLARIDAAERDQLLEAARFFTHKIAVDRADVETAKGLSRNIAKVPFAHVPQLEELARAVLAAAAQDPGLANDVQLALDGASRKQFVLGGAEIVALAVVAVVALKVIVTRGVGEKSTESSVVMHPDGRVEVKVKEGTRAITIADDLAAMFKGVMPRAAGSDVATKPGKPG